MHFSRFFWVGCVVDTSFLQCSVTLATPLSHSPSTATARPTRRRAQHRRSLPPHLLPSELSRSVVQHTSERVQDILINLTPFDRSIPDHDRTYLRHFSDSDMDSDFKTCRSCLARSIRIADVDSFQCFTFNFSIQSTVHPFCNSETSNVELRRSTHFEVYTCIGRSRC